jgi:hypothetical protein
MVPQRGAAAEIIDSHLGMQWQLQAGSWLAAGLILLPAARHSCFCVSADPAVHDCSAATTFKLQRQQQQHQMELIASQDNRNMAHGSLEQQKQQQQCC